MIGSLASLLALMTYSQGANEMKQLDENEKFAPFHFIIEMISLFSKDLVLLCPPHGKGWWSNILWILLQT